MRQKGTVLYVSVFVITIFALWGFFSPKSLNFAVSKALDFIIKYFGWFYLFSAFTFLIFVLFLAFGPYGKIKLGQDDDEPDYSYFSWIAMLFSAGMGIGLVFWGVAEPVLHYIDPPMEVQGQTAEAARLAFRYSFFHWGLHPWAIYTIIGLALAYSNFRKNENGMISATFRPLFGDKVNGPSGKAIDILAVIATVFGVATSLGLGTLQINGGLAHVFGVANNTTVQLTIIIVVTILYMISATTGLDRGIKILSNLNMLLAIGLMLFLFVVGPTSFITDVFTTTIGSYLGNLIPMSFRLTPFTNESWVGSWTLFYWAWWIAWAPFVGTFIARVSKGRTIKEFVFGVLFVPTVMGTFWFSVFGGSALYSEIFESGGIAKAVEADVTAALFITLENFPLGSFLAVLAILLIITFFITSADSATFVLGMLTSNGNLHPDLSIKVIWGFLQSTIAVALLFSGGLNALQTASIVTALPFVFIMLLMVVSVNKALREEIQEEEKQEKLRRKKLDQLISENLDN